jgi:hypothetical protein
VLRLGARGFDMDKIVDKIAALGVPGLESVRNQLIDAVMLR